MPNDPRSTPNDVASFMMDTLEAENDMYQEDNCLPHRREIWRKFYPLQ